MSNWPAIEALMDQANKSRRTAQTKMNNTSSRSHSIVMLTVTETAGTGLRSKVLYSFDVGYCERTLEWRMCHAAIHVTCEKRKGKEKKV